MADVTSESESFAATLARFTDDLGYRLELITPADDPELAVVELDGHRVTIRRGAAPEPVDQREMIVPPLRSELVVSRPGDDDAWVTGRAGMRYRDLIPSRLGGRFIASHIEVCDGGPVPDLVHHHAIRFQLIFCQRGWVDVVYEDQGPAFRMHPGDCVIQPPHIRHKVLESSAGARVVEIGCPAEHDTLFDHELPLPNANFDPDRRWDGQRFVRHQADHATWEPSEFDDVEQQVTGVADATDGLADVRVLRPADSADRVDVEATAAVDGEFDFLFVLAGSAQIDTGSPIEATEGDAITLSPGRRWSLQTEDDTFRLLQVRL